MGKRMDVFFIEQFATPAGTVLLLTDAEEHVRVLDWEDYASRMHELLRLQYGVVRLEPKPGISAARKAVESYFEGELGAIDQLLVKTAGTPFQREVWAALRSIPVGDTTSYGRLAVRLGRPKAMRAVGLANGLIRSARSASPPGDRGQWRRRPAMARA